MVGVSGTDTLTPSCRPRDGANTWKNTHRYDWHRWICDWPGAATNAQGAHGTCRGSLYITGRKHQRARITPRRAVCCSYPTTNAYVNCSPMPPDQ